MTAVNPEALEFALVRLSDGTLFERFALDFLSAYLPYNFVPAGHIHDRGIDGFERSYTRDDVQTFIYQISIQQDFRSKLIDSLEKLRQNKIKTEAFFYATNRLVKNKDTLIDELISKFKVPVTIWDIDWFKYHINDSEQTTNVYRIWIESNFHEYSRPGKSYELANLDGDPRLYVFLRQQTDRYGGAQPLDHILVDSLILFALEGTDPDKGILLTKDQILETIAGLVQFDSSTVRGLIEHRLQTLTAKPRRVNHHNRENAYCLPYETRIEIENRNLEDAAIADDFHTAAGSLLQTYLGDQQIPVDRAVSLIDEAIHTLFRDQGLEFADFVLHGEAATSIEKSLPDIIAAVVDRSAIGGSRIQVKRALLTTIRQIVYRGAPSQIEYLRRLSGTYMILFLLQCDPKLCVYFSSLASKLQVYVDNSIIVPALSEYFLEPHNRRHWNLLAGARAAGVSLVVNETIIDELAAHFRITKEAYDNYYAGNEDIFHEKFIPEILIRAYYYARDNGLVTDFYQYLDSFVSVQSGNIQQQLIAWLGHEFHLEFVSDESLDLTVDKSDLLKLTDALEKLKPTRQQAENDARLVLTVYALRKKRNETGEGGIFGYHTWWLSTDVKTQRAVNEVFGEKYHTSAYIRPDFLYNYVTLAPPKASIDEAFKTLLPSLVGVGLSAHLPEDVMSVIRQFIQEHAKRNPPRVKAILREMIDSLETDRLTPTRANIGTFLRKRGSDLSADDPASHH